MSIAPGGKFGNGACGDKPCSLECVSLLSAWECAALSAPLAADTGARNAAPADTLPAPRSKRPAAAKQTYLVQAEGSPMVKIGVSSSPETRLASFQTGHPSLLTLAWTCDGDYEAVLHARFAEYRVRGEWFDLTPLSPDAVATVKRAVAEIGGSTRSDAAGQGSGGNEIESLCQGLIRVPHTAPGGPPTCHRQEQR